MESSEVATISNGGHKEEAHVNMSSTNSNGDETAVITNPGDETQTLSKKQRKKLLKRQMWLETKAERRKKEKEKLKKKIQEKRAAGEPCGNIRKKLKQMTMASSSCKQCVVVDMSFDDLMIEKHLAQCVKQISRCYSANRRASSPMQFYVTSFEGKCVDVMSRQEGYNHWDVYFKTEKYTDLFPKEKLVYLSSESKNVLTSLDETKVYVIGGLVDHNVHKGLCLKLAEEKGIAHGRLPIEEFIDMKTRKVLTIDHVYRILLGVTEGKPWKDAILDTMPARKGAVGKDDEDGCEDSDSDKPLPSKLPDKSESNSSESMSSFNKEDDEENS